MKDTNQKQRLINYFTCETVKLAFKLPKWRLSFMKWTCSRLVGSGWNQFSVILIKSSELASLWSNNFYFAQKFRGLLKSRQDLNKGHPNNGNKLKQCTSLGVSLMQTLCKRACPERQNEIFTIAPKYYWSAKMRRGHWKIKISPISFVLFLEQKYNLFST